ncbi:MAG: M23 family metallopeptidase [Vulcanococcus sp.]|uniref:M23 family metallopeptidase n=1 Tax=Vulcanococcus sp. TaxID=2856995 RepID=UPI003C0AC1F7
MGFGPVRAVAVLAGLTGCLLPFPALALPERPLQIPGDTPVADLTPGMGISEAMPDSLAWPLRPGQPIRVVYPLAVKATEVDPYGWRYSSSRGAWRMHAGQDLVAPAGTPVLAMLPGRVVLVEPIDGYGLTVVLDHGRGWQSLYAHLQSANVRKGDFLTAASTLGLVGQSGRASGPHLHVELRQRQGEQMLALDPTPVLDQATRLTLLAPPPVAEARVIDPAQP